MKPVIGITCPWSVETWGDSIESGGYYYVGKFYVEAICKYGGIPLLITPEHIQGDDIDEDILSIMNIVQGILFTGGGDARKFSSDELPILKKQQEIRYSFESELMRKAYDQGIPMLGICRGYQMITEVFGGSLGENIIEGHSQDRSGWEAWHKVFINKDSWLYSTIGKEEWEVNSFHIQEVSKIPEDFIISATSEDGIIEGIEAVNHPFLVGFQFHPEELEARDEKAGKIIEGFINKSNIYTK